MNYFDYLVPSINIVKGQRGLKGGIQPGVYYVNFPNHSIALKDGSADTSSDDAWDATAGQFKLPLGHAGVLTVDGNGNTQYYEYGRYSTGKLLGVVKSYKEGNWRRQTVPNAPIVDGEIDHQAFANALAKLFGEKVDLTFVNTADPQKALAAIRQDANNSLRGEYNLATKTCGSAACSVIDAGLSGWEQFGDGVKRVFNAINPFNFKTNSFRAIAGGFTPSAKREGLEAAGYKTYTSN